MRLRVLFVMQYPGYLRYYDSTIKLLAERGHQVIVSFENSHKQAEGLRALDGSGPGIQVEEGFPARLRTWDRIPRGLRRVADWVRYLDPAFEDAHYLRRRAADLMPRPFVWLSWIDTVGPGTSRLLYRMMMALETAIPPYTSVIDFVDEHRPDVLVVTPLVTSASREPDVVKAAQLRGIPTVLGVASWDHLSSKGLIRVMPDRVVVWNETQKAEAVTLHDVPPERVEITGAQPWDRWFAQRPSCTPVEFAAKVGLPPGRRFVLFVGSTASISAPDAELGFVREWVTAIASSADPALHDVSFLIRPHPYNTGLWDSADLSDLGSVAVWPRGGANPVDDADRADYFDSMFHAAAVVGINTSAMIESAIVGRPVYTIRSERFADSQGGTMHFNYLLPEHGGFVEAADTLEEHVDQLAAGFSRPQDVRERIDRFLLSFVRPHGLSVQATPLIVDAIEAVALTSSRAPRKMPRRYYPLRGLLWLGGRASIPALSFRRVGEGIVGIAESMRRRSESLAQAVLMFFVSTGAALRKAERLVGRGAQTPLSAIAAFVEESGVRAQRFTYRAGAAIARRVKRLGDLAYAYGQRRAAARKERIRAERARVAAEIATKPGVDGGTGRSPL